MLNATADINYWCAQIQNNVYFHWIIRSSKTKLGENMPLLGAWHMSCMDWNLLGLMRGCILLSSISEWAWITFSPKGASHDSIHMGGENLGLRWCTEDMSFSVRRNASQSSWVPPSSIHEPIIFQSSYYIRKKKSFDRVYTSAHLLGDASLYLVNPSHPVETDRIVAPSNNSLLVPSRDMGGRHGGFFHQNRFSTQINSAWSPSFIGEQSDPRLLFGSFIHQFLLMSRRRSRVRIPSK